MVLIICAVLAVFRVAVQFAYSTELVPNLSSIDGSSETNGASYSLLLSKMHYLEYKFLELRFEIKEQHEQVKENLALLEKTHGGITWMLNQFEQAVGDNLTSLLSQSWQTLQLQKRSASYETLREEIFKLMPIKDPSENADMYSDLHPFKIKASYESCKAVPEKTSGKFLLKPASFEKPFIGYCEQIKYGGGWLVIQQRYDGVLDFYRNWQDYKVGFGDVGKEFWIGLEVLHKITSEKAHELLVELEDFTGAYIYAKYSGFQIGNETEKYNLKVLGTYTGTAGDSMASHKGMKFTTKDSDNVGSSSNCAVSWNGAWWYNYCGHSNLNGKHIEAENDEKSIFWYHYKSKRYGLRYTRMMIREL